MIVLEARHLETVKEILSRCVPSTEVRAFGSRVAGNAKRYSDLDLVLMGTSPLDPFTRAQLEEAFESSDLPFRVDLVEWASTASEFRQIILSAFELVQDGRTG